MKSGMEECEELMNALVPFAEQMLSTHREFFPFGGAMSHSGEIVQVGGWTGDEQPQSVEVISLIEKGFQDGAALGTYKATALVVDARVVPPGKRTAQDSIAVNLDHSDGTSVVVVFPYSFSAAGELAIEEPFAAPGDNRVFSP